MFLQYPNSKVARKAAESHLREVRAFVHGIVKGAREGRDGSLFPLQAPAFPEPGKNDAVPSDVIPTYAYNWNVSPLTPMAVSGVVWVPSESNVGENPKEYAAELEAYAKSLPATYGQKKVSFYYAQPSGSLVEGIALPEIPCKSVLRPMAQEPQGTRERIGKLVEQRSNRCCPDE